MRAITKGREPPSLTAYRQTEHSNYHDYADKDALRHALITEQGGICCYCMGRIQNGPTRMKIEHWRPQSHKRYRDQQLEYRNLLGACLGGDGQPLRLQHCDTRKRDKILLWNPADPGHHIETRIRYEPNGNIRSNEDAFDTQLNEVLNLNLVWLKNNRAGILTSVLDWWKLRARRLPRARQRQLLERERNRRAAGNGEFDPYCQVAVWWLEQRLAKM